MKRASVCLSLLVLCCLWDQASSSAQSPPGAAAPRARTAPAITASPNPVPAGPGLGSTTITWSTGGGSDGLVLVSVDGGMERPFARDRAGTSVANWINSTSAYEFRLYSDTTPRTLLASVKVSRPRASGAPGSAQSSLGAAAARAATAPAITASPNPVPAGPGPGLTTITWTTGNGSDGMVLVSTDGGIERSFARGTAGTSVANWINSSSAYEFRLYSATAPRTLLASVKVSRARVPSASGSAPRTPPRIEVTAGQVVAGSALASTTITWTTGDGSDGAVYVSTNGGPGEIFTQGPLGSVVANWINSNSAYEFRLYSAGSEKLLATVKIPARSTPQSPAGQSSEPTTPMSLTAVRARSFVAARPNPVPGGLGAGATEISWAVGTGGSGRVMMSVDGGPETQFAIGSGGVSEAPIHAGSAYEFRLYADGVPDTVLASVVVTRSSLLSLAITAASILFVLLLVAVTLKRRFRKATLPRT